MSTFDSTKTPLPEIIKQITEGKLQLPDFQRGWVWDDDHVRSLLVSVARSFPVGAVMLLETGGDIRFQVRPIENLTFTGPIPEPERLILDGQQRLTSLTQVLALDTPVKTRIANDLEELLAWIEDADDEPRTIYEAGFQPSRLCTLRSRLSAAYKGLNTLVLREGANDFFWKATIQELDHEEVAIDIHHIFPKAWCEANHIKPAVFNSIINKTPISYKANRMIGGKAPSSYLVSIQSHKQVGLDDETMDAILESHRIDPATLRADDFQYFYKRRQESLLAIIEQAMGKAIEREAGDETSDEPEDEIELMGART